MAESFVFFWRPTPSEDGRITESCLGQWWPSPFIVDDVLFATAEHYMMHRKALMFEDAEIAERIVADDSPASARTLGRAVSGFDDKRWKRARLDIVVEANLAKFGQHDPEREYLLSTGDKTLVEASPRDRIWGIGLAAEDPRSRDPEQWLGLNLLGQALMTVRERLRG